MLLVQQIEDAAYKHTDARRIIGEFLLSEKQRIEHYSMGEIAEKTFTSKSSLVRFAKGLGFDGWKEFIKAFLSELHYEETHYSDIDPNFPFGPQDSLKDIVHQLCNLQVESILDTTDQLDLRQLEKAVDYLIGARHTALLGMPPNNYVGNLFKRRMLAIGRPILLAVHVQPGAALYQNQHLCFRRIDQLHSQCPVCRLLRQRLSKKSGL